MNGNTKKRLGKKRRSMIVERVEKRHAVNKQTVVEFKVVGEGVRGSAINTGKLRRESGKKRWLQDIRVKGT